ncbi:MAG: 2-hydroxyacyl-CoA dehydratase family protein [Dehalococcoidia bacterium]
MDEERLATHLKERPAQLKQAKSEGVKVVGYFPGNYVPEELIYAAGAVPVCFARADITGSEPTAALEIMPYIGCPFARTLIGEKQLNTNPYFEMVDLFVAPITCQHLKKVAEIWDYYGDMEIFKLGVPHQYYGDIELDYYTGRLNDLKNRLHTLTGNEITDTAIRDAVELYNRIRDLFKKISLTRRTSVLPISANEFARLHHASLYADPVFMAEYLENVYRECNKKVQDTVDGDEPRVLLIGPMLADGDYSVLQLVKDAGAKIVIEEICEGLRYYWKNIDDKSEPIQSLARGYLRDKVPCAYMRYASKKRLDFALELIKEFNVTGVIWYQLLCCETYDMESFFFERELSERNIPMLTLESSYEAEGVGQTRIRIDAFIEMLKGGIE